MSNDTTADQHQKDRFLGRPVATFKGLHERITALEQHLDAMQRQHSDIENWMKSVDESLVGIPAAIDEILQILIMDQETPKEGGLTDGQG